MPKNKFQEVIFTIIMVFFMVYAMICYNISLNIGGMSNEVFLSAFHELIIMGPIAFILDFFIVSKLAFMCAARMVDFRNCQGKLNIMKNKTDIQTKNQQIDQILQEQYDAETKILESALLNVAGKTSWDEFPEESEEKIRAGYDRLITRLRETGDFNEAARAEKTGSTGAAKEKLESLEYDGNRTHRILKSAAAAVAVVMLTALVGMTAIADCRYPDKNTQTYQKTSVFEKK